MENHILWLVLAILAFGLALNLKLTMAVLHASRREREVPTDLQAGQPVPIVNTQPLQQRAGLPLPTTGQASVLLFMSSKCPSCRAVLPQFEQLIPEAEQAGVDLWLISEEPAWRLRRFLQGSILLSRAARVKMKEYRQLNTRLVSPAYFLVNHEGVLEAAGMIGDTNWLGLCAQLKEAA